MEHPVSAETRGAGEEGAPWHKEGKAWLLNACRKYLETEFGYGCMWFVSAEEWHTMLLDAYREMVALGLLTPEGDV